MTISVDEYTRIKGQARRYEKLQMAVQVTGQVNIKANSVPEFNSIVDGLYESDFALAKKVRDYCELVALQLNSIQPDFDLDLNGAGGTGIFRKRLSWRMIANLRKVGSREAIRQVLHTALSYPEFKDIRHMMVPMKVNIEEDGDSDWSVELELNTNWDIWLKPTSEMLSRAIHGDLEICAYAAEVNND